MRTHLNIVILDSNRYFAMGMEALLEPYLRQRGYPLVFFSDRYDEDADLVFKSHSLSSIAPRCRTDSPLSQHRIAIPESPLLCHRLPVCCREQSAISRRIGVEALLAEVERLLASPKPSLEAQNCPRCTSVLTMRERQVLQAFCGELTPRQVAKALQLSIKTVSAHKCGAMVKLGFTRNSELYHWLRKGGLDM